MFESTLCQVSQKNKLLVQRYAWLLQVSSDLKTYPSMFFVGTSARIVLFTLPFYIRSPFFILLHVNLQRCPFICSLFHTGKANAVSSHELKRNESYGKPRNARIHYTIDLNELISSKFTDTIFYAAKRIQ